MRKRLLMILGMVCLFLFMSSVARAEKLSVPACGFIAQGHQAEQLQMPLSMGNYIYRKDTTEAIFYTPVYLPQGSIIKWIRVHVIDNDSTYDIQGALFRGNKYTGAGNMIYFVQTSGASSSVRHFTDTSPSPPAQTLVNNDVCTYWVGIAFGAGPSGLDRRVYGVTIYSHIPHIKLKIHFTNPP